MVASTEIHRFLLVKLKALRCLSKMLGLTGRFKDPNSYDFALGFKTLLVVDDPDIHPIQRAYLCAMLDVCMGDSWRDFLPIDCVGATLVRDSKEVAAWKRSVKKHDGNKCVKCGSRKRLHVHHIVDWAESPELRTEPSNGITLCDDCHAIEHPSLGNLIKAACGKE